MLSFIFDFFNIFWHLCRKCAIKSINAAAEMGAIKSFRNRYCESDRKKSTVSAVKIMTLTAFLILSRSFLRIAEYPLIFRHCAFQDAAAETGNPMLAAA